jgi:hypothetical protein
MKRAAITVIETLLALTVLAALPVLTFAQQPQVMCRETLEAWVRDKSLNAKWNSDHTAVIMVRGGVEYICTCPSQTQPPVCKPVRPPSASGDRTNSAPPTARPAASSQRPANTDAASDFARERRELVRELQASGFIEPDFEKDKTVLLDSLATDTPAVRPEVEAAVGELTAGSPATLNEIRSDIARSEVPPDPGVAAIIRSFKTMAVPPLAKRFDHLKVGDVLLLRQPDDMASLDFYKSGWIIIVDKALSVSLRARASHTFMFVREVKGVKLFLDNMPGQGTRIKTEALIMAEYGTLSMDVARPLSEFDADHLWTAARECGIRSLKEFAKRADNWIDKTDYGPYGDGEKVCSETSRWALVKAGMIIPETTSVLKKHVGGVDFGPSDFYTNTKSFLVTPLELLPAQDHR